MKLSRFFFSVFLIIFTAHNAISQDTVTRTVGISATVQSMQTGIMFPIWVNNKISIAPSIDFQWGETIGTDFAIGINPRFYFSDKKLKPYLGVRGAFAMYTPSKENDKDAKSVDWIAGLAFGAEYFFDPRFSIGIEMQANGTKSDENSLRFNNPGNWNFNLGTMVTANLYFLRAKQ